MTLAFQQCVEKINQKVLVDLLTENALEAHVCKRVDEFCHSSNVLKIAVITQIYRIRQI